MTENRRSRHRIGVLVPFTNTNLEADLFLLRPDDVSFHIARLGGYDVDEIPDAEQMSNLGHSDIDEPLRLIAGVRPDVVMYGCTSATLSIGPGFDRDLRDTIDKSSGAKTVTAAGALVHALKTLEVERIAFASPYVSALNDDAIEFLGKCGVETVSRADFPEQLDNYGQAALSLERVFKLGMDANSDEADAIVLSCTDMRSAEIVGNLEKAAGKPVISSNQAMLFQALQLLGIKQFREGFGQLFEHLEKKQ